MYEDIKLRLKKEASDVLIGDVVTSVLDYCNIPELPANLYGFVAKKVDRITLYESQDNFARDVKSMSEGDTSVTYADSVDTIYGLSLADKTALKLYRRTRR